MNLDSLTVLRPPIGVGTNPTETDRGAYNSEEEDWDKQQKQSEDNHGRGWPIHGGNWGEDDCEDWRKVEPGESSSSNLQRDRHHIWRRLCCLGEEVKVVSYIKKQYCNK